MRTPVVRLSYHCFFFLLLVLLDFGFLRSEAQSLTNQELEALKQIAKKLNKKDWNFTVDPCSGTHGWNNTIGTLVSSVNCDCSFDKNSTCHVISLQLMRLNLTGVLPEEMTNLTYLTYLDLSRNYLSGPIPPSWGSLPVFNLSLQGNRLTGQIPKELGSMPALKSLQLENNLLEGPIPPEIGNLLTLERFFITSNNITGELPSTFAKLTNMTDFRIDGTGISGQIPDFIQNWRRVNRMDMQGTSMTGPIPSNISKLTNLTELRISDLAGPRMKFPPLYNAQHLTELVLRNCSIYGEIPPYLGQMYYLKVLDLSFNKLTGQIPDNFEFRVTQPFPLEYLYFTNNMLLGDIPPWMLRNKASNKVNMDISYNNFSGDPPPECQQATVNMAASFSALNNTVTPTCLRKNLPCLKKKHYMSLFINCGGKRVIIDGNEYQDDSIQIGTSTFNQPMTDRWAYSSTGDFVGNEDANYVQTNTSVIIATSHPELYTEARLSPLSLKYYGLCLENGNYTVQLHFAEILFTDDKTYYSNGKRIFDVFIQGVKVLKDFNIAESAGGTSHEIIKKFTTTVTDNTLEIQFYWGGKGTTAIPDRGFYGPLISAISIENSNLQKHKGISVGAIIGVMIGSLFIILLITLLLYVKGYCLCMHRKDKGKSGYIYNDINALDLQTRAHYLFSLKEIETATHDFDPSNKIGEGGFGAVYKGKLADGTTVAVKQLSSESRQGNREFLNEIGIISTLRHPNLVRIFGCCIEDNQLLLIYEFMQNNSLGRALFGRAEHQLKLDWGTRYRICVGVARGLAYLHEECALRIVHRDIKPTNILLDRDLNPKISDFGLAKLTDDATHVTTRIAGTVGYMAPEYATRGSLTHKADVYSFGVVLLEIVSGQCCTSCMQNDELVHLLDWAEMLAEQGRHLEMVDRRVGPDYSEQEALRTIKVALLCTNTNPKNRPKMSHVVRMLCGEIPIEPTLDHTNNTNTIVINQDLCGAHCSGQSEISTGSERCCLDTDSSCYSIYNNEERMGSGASISVQPSVGGVTGVSQTQTI